MPPLGRTDERTCRLQVCIFLALSLLASPLGAQRPSAPTRDTSARPNQAPVDGTAGIRGLVVDNDTGRPLGKARVTLSSDNGHGEAPAFTNTQGQFAFVPLPVGRYTLRVEKTGYARLRYGAQTELDPPIEISVTARSATEDVAIRLVRGAAIFGRITDDYGAPIVGGEVSLSVAQIIGGRPKLFPVARPAAETNDLGDYRIGDLPPGRYFVSIASAGLGSLPGGAPREWERLTAWARTLYPGTASVSEATTVNVGRGEERGGVDFAVKPFDQGRTRLGLNISGIAPPPAGGGVGVSGITGIQAATAQATAQLALAISDVPGSRGGQPVFVSFVPEDPDVPVGGPTTMSVMSGSTSMSLPNSPLAQPGDWIVFARQAGNGGAIAHVHLNGGDEQMVNLDLAPGATLSGRVVFEGTRTAPPASNVQLSIRGAALDAALPDDMLQPVKTRPKADGSFEIPNLFGTMTLSAEPPAGWTLKAVKVGSRDILDDPLVLRSGENITGVQVVLTDEVGTLAGVTLQPDGATAGGCMVALFPDEPVFRFNARRMRLVRADQHGQFLLRDLPMGNYRAAAAPAIDASTWLNQDAVDRLRALSTLIPVADRGVTPATLSCLSAP